MKLAFPHYEGDSLLHPFQNHAASAALKVAKPALVVQRSIESINADRVTYSGLELEMQVRATRREYLREWIKGILGR